MTPLPSNPRVVILIEPDGSMKIATNIDPELVVQVTKSQRAYHEDLKLGLPFQEVQPS